MDDKVEFLDHLLEELKKGKSEDEVKKEFLSRYPNEKNAWNLSSNVPYKVNNSEYSYSSLKDEKNPLVLLAEENGAFRALSQSIRIELNNNDNESKSLITDYLERFRQINLHYKKIQNLLFPYLKTLDANALRSIKEKEDYITDELNEILQTNEYSKDKILNVLNKTESNIIHENKFIYPLLEEELSSIELYEIYLKECEIGFSLIKVL